MSDRQNYIGFTYNLPITYLYLFTVYVNRNRFKKTIEKISSQNQNSSGYIIKKCFRIGQNWYSRSEPKVIKKIVNGIVS